LTPPKNLSEVLLTPVNSFSAVSLTPAINLRLFGYFWPVSTTPESNFIAGVNAAAEKLFAGVNDNGKKTVLTIRQQYLRPPGSDAAANGVIGTTMKRRFHRHPKRLEAPEAAQTT
jgi:hypothetical protein